MISDPAFVGFDPGQVAKKPRILAPRPGGSLASSPGSFIPVPGSSLPSPGVVRPGTFIPGPGSSLPSAAYSPLKVAHQETGCGTTIFKPLAAVFSESAATTEETRGKANPALTFFPP